MAAKDHESVLLLRVLVLLGTLKLAETQGLAAIRPISFTLPRPPALFGPLSANNALKTAERVHQNVIKGPSAFVNHKGSLYAGTIDNTIYDIAKCPPRLVANVSPQGCNSIHTCGQLTSLRLDPITQELLALVNFIGLLRINPQTGAMTQVVSTRTPINNRIPVYLTDFVVTSDGTIIMADASDAYTYPNDIYICLDSRPTGRLLANVPGSGITTELLPNTFFDPTSLELSTNGDLLVSEACRARVRRVSLQPSSLFAVSDFAANLPGLPDNIRATSRGTYWVAFRHARHSSLARNPLDDTSRSPMYRSMGFNMMSRQQLEAEMPSWAIIVELNQNGRVIGSLHDPQGTTFRSITEVQEFDGILYIGSDKTNYLGRIILPEGVNRRVKIDGLIQVLQSRCQLADQDVSSLRARLVQQYPHLI